MVWWIFTRPIPKSAYMCICLNVQIHDYSITLLHYRKYDLSNEPAISCILSTATMATLINCRMIVYEVEMSKSFIFISDHTRLTFWANSQRQYSVFFVICCKIVQWHFLIRHFSVKTFSNMSFPKPLSLGFYKKHNYMASKLNLSISKIAL